MPLGAFDCTLDQIVDRGSVSILISTAVSAASHTDGAPLIFFRGKSPTGWMP
jgi:hypothetical protein